MSRRPDAWRESRRLADDGFSMVEVMVAMLMFAVFAVASLGFVMTSLSATALARSNTVAKNLNQELLEGMRNLPYFEHTNVSTVPDLLDTYYTSTSAAAPNTGASGFVAAGAARDTSKGDPATGAFYRRVLGPVPGYPGYSRRVATQFLGTGTTALANPVFVSTSTGATGLPPSSTVGVRVTTLWESDGEDQAFTVESQITDGRADPPSVTLQARMSTLRFNGVLPDARELVVEAGTVNLDGSVSKTTVASAVARAAQATVANGGQVLGAGGTVAAPPTGALVVAPLGPQTLLQGSEIAAFSGTSVIGLSVSSDTGRPGAGSATTPVSAVLHGNGLGGDYLRASNQPATGSATRLRLLGPVVQASAGSCGGGCEAAKGTGRLATTSGATHSATATVAGALAGTVGLLPTTDSPAGLLQLTLSSVSVTCESSADTAAGASVAVVYEGTVRHRTYDPVTGVFGYSAPVRISADPALTTDPLAGVDLQTVVGVDGTSGSPLRLADYIQSWSSLTDAAVADSAMLAADGTASSITIPGVFTLTSKPLRDDPISTIGLQLGAASCTASDIR